MAQVGILHHKHELEQCFHAELGESDHRRQQRIVVSLERNHVAAERIRVCQDCGYDYQTDVEGRIVQVGLFLGKVAVAIFDLERRDEGDLTDDALFTVVEVLKRHALAVSDDEEPDLALELDVALELRLLLILIEVKDVPVRSIMTHFFTRDPAFGTPLMIQNFIPSFFLEHEELQAECFVGMRAVSVDEGD